MSEPGPKPSTTDVYAAIAALQDALPEVGKNRTADTGKYTYRYVDLPTVQAALMPKLRDVGLVWTTVPVVRDDGGFALRCRLTHPTSSTFVEGDYHLPKGNPQEIGSALTYARRYALCAMTGLAPDGDDDDGKAASAPPQAAPAKASPGQSVGWLGKVTAAMSEQELRGVWAEIARAGLSRDLQLSAAKDKRKKELQGADA